MTRGLAVWLLDANLLIALTHAAHVHHGEAHAWFAGVSKRRWATCALTQLAFVRLSSNPRVGGGGVSPAQAMQALAQLAAHPQHEYWVDSPEPLHLTTLNSAALVGHRQVTDAWLLGLTALKQQRLATLDRGLASFAQSMNLAGRVELISAGHSVQQPKARYAAAAAAAWQPRKARSTT